MIAARFSSRRMNIDLYRASNPFRAKKQIQALVSIRTIWFKATDEFPHFRQFVS